MRTSAHRAGDVARQPRGGGMPQDPGVLDGRRSASGTAMTCPRVPVHGGRTRQAAAVGSTTPAAIEGFKVPDTLGRRPREFHRYRSHGGATQALDANAAVAEGEPAARVLIGGHCDAAGAPRIQPPRSASPRKGDAELSRRARRAGRARLDRLDRRKTAVLGPPEGWLGEDRPAPLHG